MDEKDVKDFFDKVDSDPELQEKIKEAHGRLVQIARELGYDFTAAEMNEHLRKRWGVRNPPRYDEVDGTTASAGSDE